MRTKSGVPLSVDSETADTVKRLRPLALRQSILPALKEQLDTLLAAEDIDVGTMEGYVAHALLRLSTSLTLFGSTDSSPKTSQHTGCPCSAEHGRLPAAVDDRNMNMKTLAPTGRG